MGLKTYLNEQVSELKDKLSTLKTSEILEGEDLQKKFADTIGKLDSYKNKEIDDTMIEEVLRIQELVKELESA